MCATNDFVQIAQQFALLLKEQLGITDDVDEENVPDLQSQYVFSSSAFSLILFQFFGASETTRLRPAAAGLRRGLGNESIIWEQAKQQFSRSADRRGAGPRRGTVSRRRSSAFVMRPEHAAQLPVAARQAPCPPPTLL
jgi:hypothetical protein